MKCWYWYLNYSYQTLNMLRFIAGVATLILGIILAFNSAFMYPTLIGLCLMLYGFHITEDVKNKEREKEERRRSRELGQSIDTLIRRINEVLAEDRIRIDWDTQTLFWSSGYNGVSKLKSLTETEVFLKGMYEGLSMI